MKIAGHDIELKLEDGDYITDLLVIARVQKLDPDEPGGISMGLTRHTDAVVQAGMLSMAEASFYEAD